MEQAHRAKVHIDLPTAKGTIERLDLRLPQSFAGHRQTPFNRIAYSAAHVVANSRAPASAWTEASIDWDATMAVRHRLWSLGLGVAEAMDTAQRGMGLDWPTSLELIRRSVSASSHVPGALIACGAGTDHLDPLKTFSLSDVIAAYEMQIEAIESVGGSVILMASRALARVARTPDDYLYVYDHLLDGVRAPVIIHWLGEMFDPLLAGYWGAPDVAAAMRVAVDVINSHATRVEGVKISLLDKDAEITMRRQLDPGVKMYTGDDFNYPELIAGDDRGYSHALLGIFDAIAPAASAALTALTEGNAARFHAILEPTVPLARYMFSAPTRFYKTGVVFMAYLNGWQDHFTMVGGQESARSIVHLSELFRLADAAGLLDEPELATRRMRAVLQTHGIW